MLIAYKVESWCWLWRSGRESKWSNTFFPTSPYTYIDWQKGTQANQADQALNILIGVEDGNGWGDDTVPLFFINDHLGVILELEPKAK